MIDTNNAPALWRSGALALFFVVAMGLRVAPGKADSWLDDRFEGAGRTHLVVDVHDPTGELPTDKIEVYGRMVYGTNASGFRSGLLIRATFTIPGAGRNAVISIDLDREAVGGRWPAGIGNVVVARYYEVAPHGGPLLFDAEATNGELKLDQVTTGAAMIGFGITGTLTFVEPGPDGAAGSADDRSRTVAVHVETIPVPNELVDDIYYEPLPDDPSCDYEYCYEDPFYVAEAPVG